MDSKELRLIKEAYASIYEGYGKEMEGEMEDDEECGDKEETPKMKGKKKEKKEKEEKEDEMKEEVDLFDYLLEYLVAEGYADSNKAALAIMANMSEEWKQSIVEGLTPDQEERRRALSKAINKSGTPGYPGVNSPETRKMQGEYIQLQKLKGV